MHTLTILIHKMLSHTQPQLLNIIPRSRVSRTYNSAFEWYSVRYAWQLHLCGYSAWWEQSMQENNGTYACGLILYCLLYNKPIAFVRRYILAVSDEYISLSPNWYSWTALRISRKSEKGVLSSVVFTKVFGKMHHIPHSKQGWVSGSRGKAKAHITAILADEEGSKAKGSFLLFCFGFCFVRKGRRNGMLKFRDTERKRYRYCASSSGAYHEKAS